MSWETKGKNRPKADKGKNIVMDDAGLDTEMSTYRFTNSLNFRAGCVSANPRNVELTDTEHVILLRALVEARGRRGVTLRESD